ncbi:MAG: hypothetical protein JSV79_08130, partial [Armatimonadota bacterium]
NTYLTDRLHGSRLALLARDYVCLNTTALNPRPVELFQEIANGNGGYLYNDRYEDYPPGDHPRELKFTGPLLPLGSSSRATEPDSIQFAYYNVRLQSDLLRDTVPDLYLMLGHSGWYRPYSEDGEGLFTDDASVDVSASLSGTAPAWGFGPYTFVGGAPGENQSDQWYLSDNQLEFLSLALVGMSSNDAYELGFTSNVTPVYDSDEGEWVVSPEDLAYLLGPVAVAPTRDLDPLEVRIEAMIYAQNGSWIVIPGPWFNEDPDEFGLDPTAQDYPGYREPLNIRILVYGAITENMPADLGTAAEWTSKWGGPYGQGDQLFLSYQYDPLLRWPRWDLESETWAPRFPNFPLTSEMLIWGERVSGSPAG